MLLTRSIRRKLASGIGLVVLLVMASTLCSILGVVSYRRMVNDLEMSIGAVPRRAELIASWSLLIGPLISDIPESAPAEQQEKYAKLKHEQFVNTFNKVKTEIEGFQTAFQELPPELRHRDAEMKPFVMLLRSVNEGLNEIAGGMHKLKEPAARQAQATAILKTVSNVVDNVNRLPDPSNRLQERLQEAKSDYKFFIRTVSILGAFSVVVLVGLMFWGFQLISGPIRKLHLGVRHIAQGNYDYRLRIDTQCEISQLANAFNEMVLKVQEDQRNKEREIEERSKQLVLSERLAGAGFLASGVAHEINNPLSVIMTCAYGLESRLDDQALASISEEDRQEVREYLSLIQSESERCERITKKLLDFSHGTTQERNLYDVAAIAEEVVNMVGHLSRYQSHHLTINNSAPLHAWVNAPEIKQVLLNLVANALDATPSDGNVSVVLSETAEMVEIAVQDDGCGMTPEQMKHIFEPFFTTKSVGKGTGLGLSITHRIVVDHGGTLNVTSEGTGKGACFTLRLPKKAPVSQAA